MDHVPLELQLLWDGLDAGPARVAAEPHPFGVTRDLLALIPAAAKRGRPSTRTATFELVVYVTLEAVQRVIAEGADAATAVGRFGETAVRAGPAAEHVLIAGAQPALTATGRAPRLLDALDHPGGLGTPAVCTAARGWEPLGLGAIRNLVQEAFGPADLDCSTVRLDWAEPPDARGVACHLPTSPKREELRRVGVRLLWLEGLIATGDDVALENIARRLPSTSIPRELFER